jgi:hypothetical protein
LLRSAAGLTNLELRRQLDDEVERSNSLEATRARQAMAIADLEKEVADLRLVRYDGKQLILTKISVFKHSLLII